MLLAGLVANDVWVTAAALFVSGLWDHPQNHPCPPLRQVLDQLELLLGVTVYSRQLRLMCIIECYLFHPPFLLQPVSDFCYVAEETMPLLLWLQHRDQQCVVLWFWVELHSAGGSVVATNVLQSLGQSSAFGGAVATVRAAVAGLATPKRP